MTIPFEKVHIEPFPDSMLRITITGAEEDTGVLQRVLQLNGEAVIICATSEEELLKVKEGVMVVFTGQDRLLPFLVNALVSWMTIEGQLAKAIHHLLVAHPEEYQKAQIEAIALKLTEVPHDEAEGSTGSSPGGSS